MKKKNLFIIFLSYIFFLTKCTGINAIGTELLIEEFLVQKLEISGISYDKLNSIKQFLVKKDYSNISEKLNSNAPLIDFYIEKALVNILLSDYENAKSFLFQAKSLMDHSTPCLYEDIIFAIDLIISMYFSRECDKESLLKKDRFLSTPDLKVIWLALLHIFDSKKFPFRNDEWGKISNQYLLKKIMNALNLSDGDNYVSFYHSGKKLSLDGYYFEALKTLKKADSFYEKEIWTYSRSLIAYELCKIYFHLGQHQEFDSQLKQLQSFYDSKGFIGEALSTKLLNAESLRMSDYVKEAEKLFFEVLNYVYQTDFIELEIVSLIGLADTYRITGKTSKSLRYYERALSLAIKNSQDLYFGQIYRGLGVLYLKKGDYKKSISDLLKAKENSVKVNDKVTLSKSLISLGRLYLALGELGQARREYEYALFLSRSTSNPWIEVQVLTYLADLERMINHNPNSKFLYAKAIEVGEQINDRAKIAMSQFGLGVLAKYDENYLESLKLYKKSLEIYTSIDHLQGKGMSFIEMGEVFSLLGNKEEAHDFFTKAIMQFEFIKDKYGLVKSWRKYALHYFRHKNFQVARSYAEKSYALSTEINNEREKGKIEILFSEIFRKNKEYKRALKKLENAVELFTKKRDYLNISVAYKKIAKIYRILNNQEKEKEYLEKYFSSKNTLSQLVEKK